MATDELFSVWIIPVLLIFFIIAFLWIRSQRPSDLPPGPVPLPVLGNLLYLLAGDLRKLSESLRKKYGSLFSLSLGPHWVIFVNGIDVFVKKEAYCSDRPDVYFFTHIKARKDMANKLFIYIYTFLHIDTMHQMYSSVFNLCSDFIYNYLSLQSHDILNRPVFVLEILKKYEQIMNIVWKFWTDPENSEQILNILNMVWKFWT